MRLRRDCDAAMATIRLIVCGIDEAEYKLRQEVGSARFNLYAALEMGDSAAARDWIATLRVAAKVLPELGADLTTALDKIEELIKSA